MLVDIKIDYEKCQTPFDCKKCMQICPAVIWYCEAVKVERYKETDPKEPGAYKLFPLFVDKCTACYDCIKVCPVNAITITMRPT